MAESVRWKRSFAAGAGLELRSAKRLGACCAEVACARGAPVVARTDRAADRAHGAALAREAELWARAAALDAHVLPLLDWGVLPGGGVCFLAPRVAPLRRADEPRALAAVRAAAAAVARLGSAHGNLSTDTVLCREGVADGAGAAGGVVIGGWGATRLRRLEEGAGERDDVRALAGILYFLLAGRQYAGGKLRLDRAAVSGETRRLLRRTLDDDSDISLLEFRYDIGAALGELPVCTRALPPSDAKRRGDTILRTDLNSVNGSNSRREAELLAATPMQPPPVPVRRKSSTSAPPKRVEARHVAEQPVAPTVTLESLTAPPSAAQPLLQGGVDETVSTLVEPHLEPMESAQLQALTQHCNQQPTAVGDVFKLLFKRPVGKHPVVAYKGLNMLHVLMSEGPPDATAHAVSQDEFFLWAQGNWSRERIQSRPPQKAHRLSHCFAVGELGWYAGFLRNRATFFHNYRAVFSPRWTVRPSALQYASQNHRALRVVVSLLEAAGGVLKRAVSSGDPTELIKKSSVLPLTFDVAHAYRACCWLYATAPAALKGKMEEDLDAAHHSTRSVFRVLAGNPPVVSSLPPRIVLQLEEAPPRNIDGNVAVAAMKSLSLVPAKANGEKKKKKSKRRQSDGEKEEEDGSSRRDDLNVEDGEEAESPASLSEDSDPSGSDEENSRRYRKGRKAKLKNAANGKARKAKQKDIVEAAVILFANVPADGPPALNGNGKSVTSHDPGDRDIPVRRKGKSERKKKLKKRIDRKQEESSRRRDGSSTESGGEDSDGSESDLSDPGDNKAKVSLSKKSSKKQHSENNIPFDKGAPKRKTPVSVKPEKAQVIPKSVSRVEDRQGSKEAIQAAASGKKTPQINPDFEVAPYSVQFGPQIGSGGFGVVYKAKFRGHTVAVKKIHAHALSNVASIAEFQSEVAVLCTLKHPNILAFMGACTKPPNLMIITEFMGRGTLFDVLHQSQLRITWPMRRRFALDTCRGMRYLHDSKLLHRDLKSSNLMLDTDFTCKVGDFGLTRTSSGAAAVQMTGQCGTFQYMAVEVLANKPYSEKADVFSFGILLWEMVARKLPYFGMQPMQVGMAVVQQGMRPPIPPKTPQPLSKLMQSCWATDPARRPSFAQLVQMLEAMPE